MSSSPARRKRGCSATSRRRAARRRRSGSSTSAKPAAGRPRPTLATPKIAALLALAGLPEPDAGAARRLRSRGPAADRRSAEAALQWARALAAPARRHGARRPAAASGAELPARARFPGVLGRVGTISGWLGAFDVAWAQENPIDLDLCTRCNACVTRVPEHAIDFATRSTSIAARRIASASPPAARRRDRLRARRSRAQRALRSRARPQRAPFFAMHQPPQGYLAPGADAMAQARRRRRSRR